MTDIFISYSRRDIAFARLLYNALKENGFEPWIDWERIPLGEDWWLTIESAIEKNNVFLFIISPDSIGSDYCHREILHALENGKRVVPVIIGDLSADEVRQFVPELPRFNWGMFKHGQVFQLQPLSNVSPEAMEEERLEALPRQPQFQDAVRKLDDAIRTDWIWLEDHKTLQVDALRWEKNKREPSFLLRGSELDKGEAWLAQAAGKDPKPTVLQTQYLAASRQEEIRQQKRTNRLQRLFSISVAAGLVVAVVLGIIAWLQRNEAQAKARDALSGKLVANAQSLSSTQMDLSLLLSLEAVNLSDTPASRSGLQRSLQASSSLNSIIHNASAFSLSLSPDGKILASGGCARFDPTGLSCQEGEIRIWDVSQKNLVHRASLGENSSEVIGVSFNAGGNLVYAVTKSGNLAVWDLITKTWTGRYLRGHTMYIQVAVFSPDRRILATGGCSEPGTESNGYCARGEVRFWDLIGQQPIGVPQTEDPFRVYAMAFNPDSKMLATLGTSGDLLVYDAPNARLSSRSKIDQNWSLAFSPDGKWLAVGGCSAKDAKHNCVQGAVALWDTTPLAKGQALPVPQTTLNGQGNYTDKLVFSSDSKFLYTANYDFSVQIWDVTQKSPAGSPMIGFTSRINAMLLDGKDEILYTANLTDIIEWNAAVGHSAAQILKPGGDRVAFSSENNQLVFSAGSKTLGFWKPGAAMITQKISDDQAEVRDIVFTIDGKQVITASRDRTVVLRNAQTAQAEKTMIKGKEYTLYLPAMSSDTQLILAAGSLWETKTGKKLADSPASIHPVFNPSGTLLAASRCAEEGPAEASGSKPCLKTEVILWDVLTRKILDSVLLPGVTVSSLVFNTTGSTLAVGLSDRTISLKELKSDNTFSTASSIIDLSSLFEEKYVTPDLLAFSPDGRFLAVKFFSKSTLIFWDLETNTMRGEPIKLRGGNTLNNLAFSPDGSSLVVPAYDLLLINSPTGLVKTNLKQINNASADFAAFSPDGLSLAVGYGNHSIIIWDISGTQPVQKKVLYGHAASLVHLAFTPDGSQLLSLGQDFTLDRWDISSGTLLEQPIQGFVDATQAVSLSPDGRLFAAESRWITREKNLQGQLRLWNLDTGAQVGQPVVINRQLGAVSLAFTPDSKIIAAAYCVNRDAATTICVESELALWDSTTLQLLDSWRAENTTVLLPISRNLVYSISGKNSVEWKLDGKGWKNRTFGINGNSLALNPDGSLLAVGFVGNVNLYDTITTQAVGSPYLGDFQIIYDLAFSPDGKHLAAGTNAGKTIVWDLDKRTWQERACQAANRNLTAEEWKTYLGDQAYQKTCPNLP